MKLMVMEEQLTGHIEILLTQIRQLLKALTDDQYTGAEKLLSYATIGQHTRHVIEFYQELNNGYVSGNINYDQRKRDYAIETDREVAIRQLDAIRFSLEKYDRELMLTTGYNEAGRAQVRTSYGRELAYNLDHTVHHMALLRIGAQLVSDVTLPEDFGVAASTLKYRQACAR